MRVRDHADTWPSDASACLRTKDLTGIADNRDMESENEPLLAWDHALYRKARAVALSVRTIRKAQGKPCPEDLPPDSPEFLAAEESLVCDLLNAVAAVVE